MSFKIYKKRNNVYDFKGEELINFQKIKYQNINNEIYSKTEFEEILLSPKKLRDRLGDLSILTTYKFKLLDYEIKLNNFIGNNNYITSHMDELSENQDVNGLLHLDRKGVLDNRIRYIDTKKKSYDPLNLTWYDILEQGTIDVDIINYGYNNILYYNVKIEELFKANPKNIDHKIKTLFERFANINFDRETKENILLKYLNHLINFKKQKL